MKYNLVRKGKKYFQYLVGTTGILIICGIAAFSHLEDNIHKAVQDGDIVLVKMLTEKNPELINKKDEEGRTPLHWAARSKNYEILAYLVVNLSADVNALDNNQIAPLHNLAVRNLVKEAELLINNGANVNIMDYNNQTPLHHTSAYNLKEISALLVKSGAKLEIKDNWGRTPLMLCARERGGPELAEILVMAGANVNVRDKSGATSLNLAAWRGKQEVVDVLLKAGAEVLVKGRQARILAEFAASHALESLFDKLDSGGADLMVTHRTGGTLLHEAAGGGSVKIIQILIDKNLDPKHKDIFGWTPLHYAAKNGRKEAVNFLIKKEVDKNARTIMGQSPYNVAQEFKQKEVIDTLIGYKVDQSPLQFPTLEGDYLGQSPPSDKPEVFALGIVSSIWGLHSTAAFSPDNNTVLWTPMVLFPRAIYSKGIIYMMTKNGNTWTAPKIAPFSGKFDDDVPFYSPDNSKLYFISSRPLPEVPNSQKERIWYMDKTDDGWSEPKPVDTVVNSWELHWQFSVDDKGNLYFNSSTPQGYGRGDIYCSNFHDGLYQEPKNLGPAVNSEKEEATPYIAPDRSYLIFQRDLDLYICFNGPDGAWTQAKSIGSPINSPGYELCPIVSPDGEYLFFISSRGGENQVFWVKTDFIERLRKEILKN